MADKRHTVPVAYLVIIILFLSSCALVKENRDPCPCLLEIHLTGTQGSTATIQVDTGEDTWNLYAAGDTVLHVYVPRTSVTVTAWSGAPEPFCGVFCISPGTAAPPLYLCQCTVNALGDETIVRAQLRKQFCTLQLFVEGPPGWGTPFSTRIRGTVAGIGSDGIPVEGNFDYSPDNLSGTDSSNNGSSSPWTWSARIPRQFANNQLLLDIVMEDSTVRTFSLDSYLLDAGFDWSAPDLEDLDLCLHLSVTAITLRSPTWRPEETLSINI